MGVSNTEDLEERIRAKAAELGFYERCVFPIMYNYSRDPAVFQRNAAVAMGNSGDARYVPHLEAELANPDPAVRSHVEWALLKLANGS